MQKDYRERAEPTFSLVFLTWNSANCIERTLDSVLDQSFSDYEVVVVDNASQDETVSIIESQYLSRFDDIRLVSNDSNLGFSRGINQGIEVAQGTFICCYNDDTYFPTDYLSSIVEHVSVDTVWTTARINHRVSSERQTVRLLSSYGFPIPYNVTSGSGVTGVNYVPGDGLIIPRPIYENELDRLVFDPALPVRAEDLSLSLRLQKSGVPLKTVLDTYSVHPDSGFFDLTIANALKHLENVYARFEAYRRNDGGLLVLLSVLASMLLVPIEVYVRPFPRSESEFRKQTRSV